MDDHFGLEKFEHFSTLVERAMKTLGVDDVEDMVLDFMGYRRGGFSLNRDGGVDLLEGLSMTVEFTIQEPRWWARL